MFLDLVSGVRFLVLHLVPRHLRNLQEGEGSGLHRTAQVVSGDDSLW